MLYPAASFLGSTEKNSSLMTRFQLTEGVGRCDIWADCYRMTR